MSGPLKIIVAGGGIGGLAAGLALARAGFDAEVIEEAAALGDVGAGIQISPNAVKVLRALEVGEAVEAVSSRPEALMLRHGRSGGRIFSIPMGEAAEKRYGAPYLHVHRADLIEALRAGCEKAGVKIRLGGQVAAYSRDGPILRVGVDTGEVIEAHVLIGADGIHSTVRRQMLGEDRPRFTGAVAWRALAPSSLVRDLPLAAVVWAGPKRHAVTYRVRRGELVNFVGVVEESEWDREGWNETGDKAELLKAFDGWATPVTDAIKAAPKVHRWALFDRDPLPRWTDGRVALLGDACHPMPPFQAQGAAMAIEDAFVLARCLAEGSNRLSTALRAYEAIRKPRTTRVLASARGNMGVFHRSNPLSRAATYGPMRLADAVLPAFVHARQDWIYSHDVTKPFRR